MAETTAKTFVIAALIFAAILTGSLTMISLSVPERTGNFTNYNDTFDKFAEMKEDTEEISSKIRDPEKIKEGDSGILTGFWDISIGALQQIWNSIDIMESILISLTRGAGPYKLPSWFTGLFISIILATVAFAVMSAWFKWRV